MISRYLQSIPGIESVALVLLLVCFAAFVLIVIRAVRAEKSLMETMAHLPLDDDGPRPLHSEKGQP
jgi:cbb3-type cytochrome oxidase subunit 3